MYHFFSGMDSAKSCEMMTRRYSASESTVILDQSDEGGPKFSGARLGSQSPSRVIRGGQYHQDTSLGWCLDDFGKCFKICLNYLCMICVWFWIICLLFLEVFLMVLEWFCDYFGMICWRCFCDFGMICLWFPDDVWMILMWFWYDFGMTLGRFW